MIDVLVRAHVTTVRISLPPPRGGRCRRRKGAALDLRHLTPKRPHQPSGQLPPHRGGSESKVSQLQHSSTGKNPTPAGPTIAALILHSLMHLPSPAPRGKVPKAEGRCSCSSSSFAKNAPISPPGSFPRLAGEAKHTCAVTWLRPLARSWPSTSSATRLPCRAIARCCAASAPSGSRPGRSGIHWECPGAAAQ